MANKLLLVLIAWSKIAFAGSGSAESQPTPASAKSTPSPQPTPAPTPPTPVPTPPAPTLTPPAPTPPAPTPPAPTPPAPPAPTPPVPTLPTLTRQTASEPKLTLPAPLQAASTISNQVSSTNVPNIVAPASVLGTLLGYLNPGVAVGFGITLDGERIDGASIVTDGDARTVRVAKSPRLGMRYLFTGQYPMLTRSSVSVNAVVGVDQHADVSFGVNLQFKRGDEVGLTVSVLVAPTSFQRLADGFMANSTTTESSVRTTTDAGLDVIFAFGSAHWK